MKGKPAEDHPIRHYFAEALHDSLSVKLGLRHEDVEIYLCQMLVEFLHHDGIYGVRDATGRRVESVVEMLIEGDVRLNADSFDREREVHRHIGDFLLFWSGIFPEFLKAMKSPSGKDALLNPIEQGRFSYHVASTFDHGDYAKEAPVFRKLSAEFDTYIYGLSLVRASFRGISGSGWRDGFSA